MQIPEWTIPKRCLGVYAALCGRMGHTSYTRSTGTWRYKDFNDVTGRNSAERKLRELYEKNPLRIVKTSVRGKDSTFSAFRLATPEELAAIILKQPEPETNPVQMPDQTGQLFPLPMIGRET